MPNRSHLLIWPVLLMIVLGLSIGMDRGLPGERAEPAVAQTDCVESKKKGRERKDWGWNVFDIGGESRPRRI